MRITIGAAAATRFGASILVAASLIASCVLGSAPSHPARTVAAPAAAAVQWNRSCAVTTPGRATCNVLRVTSTPAAAVALTARGTSPSGLSPAGLRRAYGLAANGGRGQTIAVVVAYNDPKAAKDLAVYRKEFGLPACTTANRCFRKVSQTGSRTALPASSRAWAAEVTLDLDMVSAIAPRAHIILVEAKSSSLTNLGTAVNRAVRLGARFVSNSYGVAESTRDATYDARYFNHPGVVITASSGDAGYGVEYPAASPYVVAVGGTTLAPNASARGWGERAWSDSARVGGGSGCSAYEPKPSWQKDTGCSTRSSTKAGVPQP